VRALKAAGFAVSVDSVEPEELLRGGRAGADYLLSLTTRHACGSPTRCRDAGADQRTPGDEASLYRRSTR
jgi:hypothetical protein